MCITPSLCYFIRKENKELVDKNKNLTPGDIETSCHSIKRHVFEKNKEITSQHFGNHISLSIKYDGLHFFLKKKKLINTIIT